MKTVLERIRGKAGRLRAEAEGGGREAAGPRLLRCARRGGVRLEGHHAVSDTSTLDGTKDLHRVSTRAVIHSSTTPVNTLILLLVLLSDETTQLDVTTTTAASLCYHCCYCRCFVAAALLLQLLLLLLPLLLPLRLLKG